MRIFFRTVIFFLLLATPSTYAQDHIALEIKLKESPVELLQELQASITLPISATSLSAFERVASDQGYRVDELKHKLQLLTRLYLSTYVQEQDKYRKTEALLSLLEIIGTTAYDESYLQMLTGRYIARNQHNYPLALSHYDQALSLIESGQGLQTQLLKQLIHYHLGSLHRILHQDKLALIHLKLYKETTYQLRTDYLIAHAESTLGNFYNQRDQLSLALQHYNEALRLSNRQQKPFLKANLQLQLARIYRKLEAWDEAIQYAHDADEGFKALNMDRLRSNCMTVIAMVHANQNNWNQAIDYYLNAQQLDYKAQNVIAQALNYHNLGEAYFNNGNTKTSFEFLFKSNAIFRARKSNHYLVFNDLLIAQVAVADKNWLLAKKHSALALHNAEKLKLKDEQIEALQYQAQAYRHLKQSDQAFATLDKLIALNLSTPEIETPTDYTSSVLAEQKLKLEVNKLQGESRVLSSQLAHSRLLLITAVILVCLISLIGVNQWRRKSVLAASLLEAKSQSVIEPVSGLPGYKGFIEELESQDKDTPHAIALISLTDQLNADFNQGFQCNNNMNKIQFQALAHSLSGKVYLIRPGLFMLSLRETITANELLQQCRIAIDKDYGDTSIHIGMLPLPLLMDPDIRLSAEVHFGAVQMTLAAALSLGKAADYYVSIKALDFAPATIFATPLYLHLEKGIMRGLLKVYTNGDKKKILWPRWKSHENLDITELT
ncbi:tetratricopeptide repeat protein [Shewanella benthica]|uniref:TPR domain protein n=1 Tax=Shewanella benthica KT99 TaxID=314608 RepID=A9D2V6_9GAMM|nr:tetratricopeptide repeat protein [Shewanella benthica]EDQ01867.1 TPR domain protein [Shewanella benthica KT99]